MEKNPESKRNPDKAGGYKPKGLDVVVYKTDENDGIEIHEHKLRLVDGVPTDISHLTEEDNSDPIPPKN